MSKHKPRFIVDSPRRYIVLDQELSKLARFESILKYVPSLNASDLDIFNAASANNRHILTQNKKDFVRLIRSMPQEKIGIVGFDPRTKTKKLVDILKKELGKRKYHEDFYCKIISLNKD